MRKADRLYGAMREAERRFEVALRYQFGAGVRNERYVNARHNAETAVARDAYQAACEAWRRTYRESLGSAA